MKRRTPKRLTDAAPADAALTVSAPPGNQPQSALEVLAPPGWRPSAAAIRSLADLVVAAAQKRVRRRAAERQGASPAEPEGQVAAPAEDPPPAAGDQAGGDWRPKKPR